MPTVTIGNNTTNTFSGLTLTELNQSDPTTAFWDTVQARSKSVAEIAVAVLTGLSNITGPVTVSSATLSLWKNNANDESAQTLSVYLLKRQVNVAQASYNVYSTGNSWQTAGGIGVNDREASASVSQAGPSAATGYVAMSSSQLATDVQNIINGVATGNALWVTTDDAFSRIVWDAEGASDGQRPFLSVTYTASGGAANLGQRWDSQGAMGVMVAM